MLDAALVKEMRCVQVRDKDSQAVGNDKEEGSQSICNADAALHSARALVVQNAEREASREYNSTAAQPQVVYALGSKHGHHDAAASSAKHGSVHDQPQQLMYDTQLASWVKNELEYQPLGQQCTLFARKFTASALPASLHMALSCTGLGLGSWCEHNQVIP